VIPKKYVLLVEDNHFDELLTRRAFAKNHLADQLEVVHDGPEALQFLQERGQMNSKGHLPALILMDFQMPRLNGVEVLEKIRADERTRQLPVVMLSSSADDRDNERTSALGLISYLRKPVDFTEFVRLVHDLSRRWLTNDESAADR